ncbi:MAG TPA: LysM domain-containing protein [Burkholderiales bacterium]|nr:LysM domain-containing protein [Burkholderiales bacterium]
MFILTLLFTACDSNVRTSRNAGAHTSKRNDTTVVKPQPKIDFEPENEVKFTEISSEMVVSIPQTIFKNLRLKIVANDPATLAEVTTFINSNLENLKYIAVDEDLKSELDRILREQFEGTASITVLGNKVVQPVDTTKTKTQKVKQVVDTKQYHTVRKGEGFLSISRIYSTSVNNLYRLNPGKKQLSPGDRIRIK